LNDQGLISRQPPLVFFFASLQWTVRVAVDAESKMTSVERLVHYAENLDPEEDPDQIVMSAPARWPAQGYEPFHFSKSLSGSSDFLSLLYVCAYFLPCPPCRFSNLTFKDVRMAYRLTDNFILKGINLEIRAAEKVGIVGRTGAG
jgi:ABC-type multidrug transport system fused ATPase/permease subunit